MTLIIICGMVAVVTVAIATDYNLGYRHGHYDARFDLTIGQWARDAGKKGDAP